VTLEGKVVLITGAGSGIGRALATGFAGDGAHVLGFDVNRAGLEETAKKCAGGMVTVEGDVSSEADVDRLVAAAMECFGRTDVLFNNAGISDAGPLEADLPFENWARVIRVNLIGLALCTNRVLPVMVRQGYGRIINVVSRAAESRVARNTAYAASKAGVVSLTRTLASALEREGHRDILVNAMVPGPTRTPIWGAALADARPGEELLNQLQDPDAVYPHARYLAELPSGGPSGRVFWNSREYPMYAQFND